MGATGVCGTDLHIGAGDLPHTRFPLVPGHELAGEVLALGEGVDDLAVGTRVAVDPTLFCHACRYCQAGRGNLCERWGALGDTQDGGMAEYVTAPRGNAHELPDGLSLREGALVEPVACAVHGLHRLRLSVGEHVLVVGAGTMGLILLQLARRGGAASVSVVDLDPGKLVLAERLGARATATSAAELDDSFDVAIDATGHPAAIEMAFGALRRGGRLMVFGVAGTEARLSLSPYRIFSDEITVLGSMSVLHSFRPALDLMATGAIDTRAMLGASFPLDGFGDALDAVRDGTGGVKVQVLPGGVAA